MAHFCAIWTLEVAHFCAIENLRAAWSPSSDFRINRRLGR